MNHPQNISLEQELPLLFKKAKITKYANLPELDEKTYDHYSQISEFKMGGDSGSHKHVDTKSESASTKKIYTDDGRSKKYD